MARIADRNPKQHYIPKAIFEGAKNGLMECTSLNADGLPCDWAFFGPRTKFQAAWTEHWRQCHSEEVGVVIVHDAERHRSANSIILAR